MSNAVSPESESSFMSLEEMTTLISRPLTTDLVDTRNNQVIRKHPDIKLADFDELNLFGDKHIGVGQSILKLGVPAVRLICNLILLPEEEFLKTDLIDAIYAKRESATSRGSVRRTVTGELARLRKFQLPSGQNLIHASEWEQNSHYSVISLGTGIIVRDLRDVDLQPTNERQTISGISRKHRSAGQLAAKVEKRQELSQKPKLELVTPELITSFNDNPAAYASGLHFKNIAVKKRHTEEQIECLEIDDQGQLYFCGISFELTALETVILDILIRSNSLHTVDQISELLKKVGYYVVPGKVDLIYKELENKTKGEDGEILISSLNTKNGIKLGIISNIIFDDRRVTPEKLAQINSKNINLEEQNMLTPEERNWQNVVNLQFLLEKYGGVHAKDDPQIKAHIEQIVNYIMQTTETSLLDEPELTSELEKVAAMLAFREIDLPINAANKKFFDRSGRMTPEEIEIENAKVEIMRYQAARRDFLGDKLYKPLNNLPTNQFIKFLEQLNAPEFKNQGACNSLDPELFYPGRGQSTEEAKAVCNECSVRGDCLEYAIELGEKFGVWGGLSERERRRIRKQRNLRLIED